MNTNPTRKFLLLIGCMAAGVFGRAQSATPPNAPRRDAGASEEKVVTLSEFTVSAGSDKSYTPTESTTGSRVNAKIKDLPQIREFDDV